ncbi:MAG: HAMP domain-containing protein [Gammaproteobacteria bacterium]|nr:HAMP domain-containing protein [Gammaproteobacteria bacterium]
MTQISVKRFYTFAIALATVLFLLVMVQLGAVISDTASADLLIQYDAELMVANLVAAILFLLLIGMSAFRLIREYRQREPGTQLALRILRNIAVITFFSMAVVYVFSFLALSRGIDNWFELQVGEAVEEANQLRVLVFDSFETRIRSELDDVVEELAALLRQQSGERIPAVFSNRQTDESATGSFIAMEHTISSEEEFSFTVIVGSEAPDTPATDSENTEPATLSERIFELIFRASQSADYEEITYFEDLTRAGGMVVSSSTRTESLLPVQPSQRLIEQFFLDPDPMSSLESSSVQESGELPSESEEPGRDRRSGWELYHGEDGSALLRMLIPIPIAGPTHQHYLQVLTTLPSSSQRLAERISQLNERHERLEYLRNPLKISFVLALTFVTLFVMLLATLAAIGLTRHLVEPIRTLLEGTKAVAEGRYESLQHTTVRDDFGVLVNSFNEMTRRIKVSQEQISQSRLLAEEHSAYLEIVLEHLSSGVMFFDRDQRLTNINLATESILGIKAAELIDDRLSAMIERWDTYSPLFESIAGGIDRKDSEWSDTVKLHSRQGDQILAYSGTKLPIPASASATHVVVVEDITALAEAQRGEAWKAVAQRMAHEMLNPLQPIQLAVDRIQYKTDANLTDEQRQSLELSFAAIGRQLHALRRIVKDFQNYSKPIELQISSLNLNELIREVTELHEKNEQIEQIFLQLDPELPKMSGDPDKLVQVFNNLIKNAREATEDSKKTVLQIESQTTAEGNIVVSIIDNGPGFKSEVLGKMFEPYATTKKRGMGLGLEIVKRIVEAHDGTVLAENVADGVGAKIQLEFRLEPTPTIAEGEVVGHNDFHNEESQ